MPGKVGRPRKAEKYGGQIAAAEDLIADRLPELVEKAFELASGVQAVRHMRDGGEVVYDEPPSIKAIVFLVERIMGKATQAVEHSGPDGDEIRTAVTIYLPDNGRGRTDADPPASGPPGGVA